MSDYSLDELHKLKELVKQLTENPPTGNFGELHELYIDISYRTPSFDWNNWSKGLQGLKNSGSPVFSDDKTYCSKTVSPDFQEFDLRELGQLLLMIHRVNRFSEGYYDDLLENGVVLNILERMINLKRNDT